MKRIAIAFLISLLGIAASWIYLRPKEWTTSTNKDRTVIAKVVEVFNDVNRQEEGRLLWSPLRSGDIIYLGDKIKTSGLSSASLQFLESSSKLEIEENSTVKMEGGGKKLALNMMEGRVFLKQDKKEAEHKLDLISGGKKIAVEGNVAVSLNQDGTSQVDDFNSSLKDAFQDLRPHYGQELLNSDSFVELRWNPISGNEEVSVELGESPLLLRLSPLRVPLSSGKMIVNMKPGVNYWRLTTKKGSREVRSSLMRLNIKRPIPPIPVFPSVGQIISLKEKKIEYKWALGNVSEIMVIEVARDNSFKEMVERAEVKNQTFYTSEKFYDQGDYYWRIKSPSGSKEWIESKIVGFKILHGENLLSPLPVSPAEGSIFYIDESMSRSVRFEWNKQDKARAYQLVLEGSGVSKKVQLTQESVQVNLNRPGSYSWLVTSESPEGKISSFPVKRHFEVRQQQKISWRNLHKNYHYLEGYPIIILEWEQGSFHSFILKISQRADMSESETFQVKGRDFPYRPSRDGFHYARIIGLDETGQVAGESIVHEFKIEKAPLPPVPAMKEEKILASPRGKLVAELKNYQSNWSILSQIINNKGVIVDERRFSEPRITFNGLLPGSYSLQTVFLDQYQRKSTSPLRVEVIVPEKSMIAAPKIKGIKVR